MAAKLGMGTGQVNRIIARFQKEGKLYTSDYKSTKWSREAKERIIMERFGVMNANREPI